MRIDEAIDAVVKADDLEFGISDDDRSELNYLSFGNMMDVPRLDADEERVKHPCFSQLFEEEWFRPEFENEKQLDLRSWLRIRYPEDDADCNETQIVDLFLQQAREEGYLLISPVSRRAPGLMEWTALKDITSISTSFKKSTFLKYLVRHVDPKQRRAGTHWAVKASVALKQIEQFDNRINDVHSLLRRAYGDRITAHCQLLSTVYVMAHANVPMLQYTKMIGFIKRNFKNEIGKYHTSRRAGTAMLLHIGENIRQDLINLISSDECKALSIIVDDTTALDSTKLMTVSFRLLRHVRTRNDQSKFLVETHFYSLVRLKHDTNLAITAHQHMEAFVDQLKSDAKHNQRFYEAVRMKTTAVSGDGAAVNIKFIELLSAEFGKTLQFIHCSAHRLQLAMKDAVKSLTVHQTMDSVVTSVHGLFHGRKKALLWQKLNNQRLSSLRRSHEIRWLSHDRIALQRLIDLYDPITKTLSEITTSSNFKDSADKALKALNGLRDRKTAYYIHFYADILNCLAPVSLQYQYVNSMGSEVAAALNKAILELDKLTGEINAYGGSVLKAFVKSCTCDRKPCATYRAYFTASRLVCGELLMSGRESQSARVRGSSVTSGDPQSSQSKHRQRHRQTPVDFNEHELRAGVILRMKNAYQKRFRKADDILSKTSPFDVKLSGDAIRSPTSPQEIDSIKYLAQHIVGVDQESAADEWIELWERVAVSDMNIWAEGKSSVEFWLRILDNHATFLPRHDSPLQEVIKFVLTLEPNSAGAERAFSMMSFIKSSRRSLMSLAVLNAYMTIHYHVDPADYDSLLHAIKWLLKVKLNNFPSFKIRSV